MQHRQEMNEPENILYNVLWSAKWSLRHGNIEFWHVFETRSWFGAIFPRGLDESFETKGFHDTTLS